MSSAVRRATNLTIDAALLDEAKALNLNLSKAAEGGIAQAIVDAKTRQWQAENAEAIKDFNRYIEENGLPLEKYRPF
jgi:antitoxin CcdA